MGAPYEAADVDTTSVGVREHPSDLRVRGAVEALVVVAAPVGEQEQVALSHLRDPVVQLSEVGRAVDEGTHQVALGPRHPSV